MSRTSDTEGSHGVIWPLTGDVAKLGRLQMSKMIQDIKHAMGQVAGLQSGAETQSVFADL